MCSSMKNRVNSLLSHCRLETRANLIHMGSACMMTNLNRDLNISLGKKITQANFLSPKEGKKYVVLLYAKFLTSFTLICLVNRSTIEKKRNVSSSPNMLLGVKLLKRGEFFAIQ